ncbi:hypothetical protein [Priestia megaterium]|nr:hypothetical protein [Priestia megaterium]QSF36962.1 hypothetical protein ICR96_15995 [Priestia megaterium]
MSREFKHFQSELERRKDKLINAAEEQAKMEAFYETARQIILAGQVLTNDQKVEELEKILTEIDPLR